MAADEVYDPLERMAREEWEAWIGRRLEETVGLARRSAPAARRAVEAVAADPQALRWPRDLVRVPLLRKSDLPALQEADPPFGGWGAIPVAGLRRVFVSPGPIYDPQARGADYWGFAPALFAAGFRPGDLVLNTFAYHLTPAGHMLDEGLEALGCVVVPGGVGNTETQARTAAALGARGFVGTPSFLATLLDRPELGAGRSAFAAAFVSGEMLTDRMRADLQSRGVRVSQGYATADVGLIGYECAAQDGLHLSLRVYVEIVDPQTALPRPPGEAGEVVVTFLSETYPLLRLATGDLSALDSAPCRCGRGTPKLTRIMGRVGDAVKVRGMFVHPQEVRRAMSRVSGVDAYQLVVERQGYQDRLVARVELRPHTSDPRGEIAAQLREAIKLRAEVEVVSAGTLPAEAPVLVDARRWE